MCAHGRWAQIVFYVQAHMRNQQLAYKEAEEHGLPPPESNSWTCRAPRGLINCTTAAEAARGGNCTDAEREEFRFAVGAAEEESITPSRVFDFWCHFRNILWLTDEQTLIAMVILSMMVSTLKQRVYYQHEVSSLPQGPLTLHAFRRRTMPTAHVAPCAARSPRRRSLLPLPPHPPSPPTQAQSGAQQTGRAHWH